MKAAQALWVKLGSQPGLATCWKCVQKRLSAKCNISPRKIRQCIFYDFQITTAAVFLDLLRTQEISAVLHRVSSQKQKDQLFPHEVVKIL